MAKVGISCVAQGYKNIQNAKTPRNASWCWGERFSVCATRYSIILGWPLGMVL
jgi:hypothetical protein